jgi:hypothetical protein
MTKARTLADNFAADINGITAGTGITGGGTSGTVTVTNSMATTIDAKGDLVVGTGADTFSRLAVASTAGYLLSVDSAETTGLKWAAPASGGGMTLLTTSNFPTSGSATHTISSISTDYTTLYIVVVGVKAGTGSGVANWELRVNSDTSANYAIGGIYASASGTRSIGNTEWNINPRLFSSTDAHRQDYAIITFPRYTDTSARIGTAWTYGIDETTTPNSQFSTLIYKGSSAITSVTFLAGANYVAGTAYVYGVK